MSRFYGWLRGRRNGVSTRCGDNSLETTAAGHAGAITVEVFPDSLSKRDRYRVWYGANPTKGNIHQRLIACGFLDEAPLNNA